MKKTAIFTGTFDPPTLGHLEIIQRASVLFDKLYVAIFKDNLKRPSSLSADERMDFMRKITSGINNVEVVAFSGLTVDCAEERKAGFIVRGIRNGSDLDFEAQMAAANRQMTGVETVLLFASQKYGHISSTLIRQIAFGGRRLHGFVPEAIEQAVFEKLGSPK